MHCWNIFDYLKQKKKVSFRIGIVALVYQTGWNILSVMNEWRKSRPSDMKVWINLFYFSTKAYVVGAQKNHLNETFFWAPKTYVQIEG